MTRQSENYTTQPIRKLHHTANVQTIRDHIRNAMESVYTKQHYPIIRNTGNYDMNNMQFETKTELPKHFIPAQFTPAD